MATRPTTSSTTTQSKRVQPPSPTGSDATTNSNCSSDLADTEKRGGEAEVAAAVDFVARYLSSSQSQLTDAQTKQYLASLTSLLHSLIKSSAWSTSSPHKGSASRCLMNHPKRLDKTFQRAASENSIPLSLIHPLLPTDLVLWIDPGTVCYRVGSDHSPVIGIWEDPAVTQQRMLQQQQIKLKWSQGQHQQQQYGNSPPQMTGYITPPSGYMSGHNSPQLTAQQVNLPQKTRVVMKMPGSASTNSSSSTVYI